MGPGSSSTASNDSDTKEPLQQLLCSKCNAKFPNTHELLVHLGSEKHFLCSQCDSCFWTQDGLKEHKRKVHRPGLDLECFGCHSHFDRAGRFWQHLESGECKVIFPSDLARLREKNLEFAKQLELRKLTVDEIIQSEQSHITGDNTWAPQSERQAAAEPVPVESVTIPDTLSRPGPIAMANAHPLHYRNEDFPLLPIKENIPVSDHERNVWLSRRQPFTRTSNSITASYNAVPPPASYDYLADYSCNNGVQKRVFNSEIRVVRASGNRAEENRLCTTSSGRVVDPGHPDYNPAVYYNDITEKFVCPYKSCGKKFSKATALTQHFQSPTHSGGRLPCIRCRKIFTTVASLISHMETAKNCPILETDGFQRALGQITGGILGFHERSGVFIIDKTSVQELFDLRSRSLMEPGGKDTKGL